MARPLVKPYCASNADLAGEYLFWLEFDLKRMFLPRHNSIAFDACLWIMALEAL